MSNIHNELKKEFQLERMILFSDAVFAIAITLMAIEIKVPVMEDGVTDKALLSALSHLFLKFFSFLISFFLIGLYWTVHHRMFSYVENYDQGLLWLNLLFLLSIVLMPFSAGIYGEYSHRIELIVPYTVYVSNICFTGYFNYLLWKYISNPENNLANPLLTTEVKELGRKRGLAVPAVFLLSLLVTLFLSVSIWFAIIGRCMLMFIPLVMKKIDKRHHKKTTVIPNS
jgi:uncharacterized membrane protein